MQNTLTTLSTLDRSRLWRLWEDARSMGRTRHAAYKSLAQFLEKSRSIAPEQVPAGMVTMNSLVTLEDLATGEVRDWRLSYPSALRAGEGEISVLSPAGLALLGKSVGEIAEFDTPAGTRRVRVAALPYQPEAAGHFHL